MEVEPENPSPPAAKTSAGDRIAAIVLAGLIAVWLVAYVIFTIRARIG